MPSTHQYYCPRCKCETTAGPAVPVCPCGCPWQILMNRDAAGKAESEKAKGNDGN